ncbi:MAG: cytochrome c-type biosis protein CcmH [Solirubrobacteraceae bacterium]|jgi:cytochrome c-type biogenesis protein CcmH/NrfF|nr:cytochrome c-type biosis protein CcmH [Solirubrobacteraceae bacterium]MDX6671929.1 cytochrome c-type biosis protein CcmH [Solirubrobacteraceae bacterium]
MRFALLPILVALVLAAPAQAAVSFTDVEDEVMCTVCGTPLNLAPQDAPFAMRQRAFIRRQIAQGRSKEQIKDALVAQYGDGVLGLPRSDGFNVAAYAVPLTVGLVALALLLFIVARWRKPGAPEPVPAASSMSTADRRRLDDDLRRYD